MTKCCTNWQMAVVPETNNACRRNGNPSAARRVCLLVILQILLLEPVAIWPGAAMPETAAMLVSSRLVLRNLRHCCGHDVVECLFACRTLSRSRSGATASNRFLWCASFRERSLGRENPRKNLATVAAHMAPSSATFLTSHPYAAHRATPVPGWLAYLPI